MNYSNYRITLDVRNTVANVQLTAKKGDAGRKIYITLSDKGKPCEIADDSYAVFAGVKPDGTKLYNKTTIENNTIIYEMTQQTTAVAGLVACEVKLFDSMSNLLTSPKLTILVDDVVVPDEEIVSKDEVSALAELILDVTATGTLATEAADTANAAAGNANAAAQAANDAAASADRAAEVADSAANNASTKAAIATQAATAANTAADSAYMAAGTANEAANTANAAAEETLAAKEGFLIKAEEALEAVHAAATEDAPAIVCESSGEVITLTDASDRLLRGLTLYGKTTQNGTPSPDAPVALESAGASGSIGVTVAGKNLWRFEDMTIVAGSDIATNKTDTGFTLTCRNSENRYKKFKWLPISILDGKTITVSVKIKAHGGVKPLFVATYISDDGSSYSIAELIESGSFSWLVDSTATKAQGKQYIGFTAYSNYGSTTAVAGDYSEYADIQIEIGTTATAYEPYKGQTLSVSTPNGLPGIDSFADEIDFARGVRVQRAYEYIVTGDETIGTGGNTARVLLPNSVKYPYKSKLPMLCNRFSKKDGSFFNVDTADSGLDSGEFSHYYRTNNETRAIYFKFNEPTDIDTATAWFKANETRVLIPLETPVETPLSAEELAAFAYPHTYKPNTTVYNDSGAGMGVSYVADTKTYIDNKLAQISAAILNA